MRHLGIYQRSAPAQVLKWLGYAAVAAALGAVTLGESSSLAQRERNRNRNSNRARVSGNAGAQIRVPAAGAEVRTPAAGAEVRTPMGGGQVRVPTAGGEVRVPATGAEVRTPAAGGQIRVPPAGGEVRVPGGGAEVRTPAAGGQVRVPGAGAEVRTPPAGGEVRAPGAGVEARVPGAGGQVRVPGAGGEVRVPGGEARTALRPNLDADVRGGARLDGSANARIPGGVRIDSSVANQANLRFSPNWANLSREQRQQLDQFRSSLNTAMRGEARVDRDRPDPGDRVDRDRGDRIDWFDRNPNRRDYWSRWGNNARNSFRFGADPFFNYNWWNGRSLIGIGMGGYGYNYGPGYGGWWGYQPWRVNQPWWYWYSRPAWGSMLGWFPGYGWNQPYYYDYGPGGNVVYTGSQVYVNSQPVGTAVEYAQTAAELAAVDPATVKETRPEDWMPLGTFTLATAQDESDPARVIQLALNKEGLISGTSFNKRTGKTYTVQGRVDKDTQRTAFTIGNSTDIVMETGLFNLTQEETPVLAHLGPSKTATYLLARLPEPKHEAEDTAPRVAAEPTLP